MSVVAPSFETRKRVRRTRDGEASVITDELLGQIAAAIKENGDPEGLTILSSHPRNTKGSAAGFGHQIRAKLAKAPYNLQVHSAPVPVDEEAYEKVPQTVKDKPKDATGANKEAVKFFAAFYPYQK